MSDRHASRSIDDSPPPATTQAQNSRASGEQKFGDISVGDARGRAKAGSRESIRRPEDTVENESLQEGLRVQRRPVALENPGAVHHLGDLRPTPPAGTRPAHLVPEVPTPDDGHDHQAKVRAKFQFPMKANPMTRQLLSLTSIALLLAPAGCGTGAPESATPTSILWITVDTLRVDHIGSYGYFRNTTPRIDALAAQSFHFDNCVVPMATTLPSHLSMLTGTLPIEHGVLANVTHGGKRFVRSSRLVSFAEVLSAAGYATAGFISARPLQSWTGIDAGFGHYSGPEEKERRGEETVDLALTWLEEQRAEDPERPVFLWVHLFDPHAPFRPTADFEGTFGPSADLDAYVAERDFELVTVAHGGAVVHTVDSINRYDAEILYTDGQVGRLLDALEQQGMADQTAVLFHTDHGEGVGQHGVARHGLIWNELVDSAFLLHVPGQAGRRVATPISSIDSFPTLLGQVEIPGCESFLAQCTGGDALAADYGGSPQWSQSSARLESYGEAVVYSIRRGNWKYMWLSESDGALYDLTSDPHERVDVASAHPELCEELRTELLASRAAQEQRGRDFGSGVQEDIDPQTLQDLRDLGYTGMDENE